MRVGVRRRSSRSRRGTTVLDSLHSTCEIDTLCYWISTVGRVLGTRADVFQHCFHPGPNPPIGRSIADVLRKCARDPPYRLCQMNASLSSSSISFSVHSRVGKACRNMRISWKFIFTRFSDHLIRKAAQT